MKINDIIELNKSRHKCIINSLEIIYYDIDFRLLYQITCSSNEILVRKLMAIKDIIAKYLTNTSTIIGYKVLSTHMRQFSVNSEEVIV